MRAPEKFLVKWEEGQGPARTWVWDARKPLSLGNASSPWILEKAGASFRMRSLTPGRGQALAFDRDLQTATGRLMVRDFQPQTLTAGQTLQAAVMIHPHPETDFFARSLKSIHVVLLVGVFSIWGWGKFHSGATQSMDEKIIPPQFAKLLLKPKVQEPTKGQVSQAGGAAGEGASADAAKSNVPMKAQNTAVVKAFRAKALQSAVQGLLKGGMTSLLAAESQLLAGDSKHQASRLFDRAAEGNVPAAPSAQAGNGRGVQVAALGGGGGGAGGGVGTAVGYGAGRGAAISGQGQSFVSLDLPGTSVEEGLTKEEVGKVIHAHISEIRYCYESSMLRSSDIEGKLVLDFTIGGTGAVKTAAVKESSLNDPRLDDCILRRLTKWSFPKPNGGVDVAVSYPFIFKALTR